MEETSLDTDIDNYSKTDILNLLDLEAGASEVERNDAVDNIITNMRNKNNSELVEFFIQAKTKLFESSESESESEAESQAEVEPTDPVDDTAEEPSTTTMLSGKDRWELPAPPWYLNTAATRTITQDMSVDTRFRPDYYTTLSTNFTMDLPEPQKKVVSMRISAIEMPMTYYSISRGLGNNTMVIISDEVLDNANYIDYTGNSIADFTPTNNAWLVHITDGNYDTISWMNAASRAKAETAVNEALSLASPGAVDEMGRFYKLKNPVLTDYLNTSFQASGEDALEERQDIRFIMNKINGKSVFSTPLPGDIITGTYDSLTTTETNRRKLSMIRFNVDIHGHLDTDTNIQMKLGWTLGFRASEYVMGNVSPVTTSTPISAVSEGTGFITGPRYAFLSIEDYLNNARPSFIVAYGTHTRANNIITRINLGGGGYHNLSTRDAGLTGHANRTREYFGPVDIQKLTIKLQDEYGRIIDINNMDWSFTVTFKKIYN